MGGLLHDVGRFLMFMSAPEQLREIDEGKWESAEELLEMERGICGLSHADLGALACEKWHFPDYLCEAIRDHHSNVNGQSKSNMLARLIHVADIAMFPSAMPGSPGLHEESPRDFEKLMQPHVPDFIRCTMEELQERVRVSTEEADKICIVLGVA